MAVAGPDLGDQDAAAPAGDARAGAAPVDDAAVGDAVPGEVPTGAASGGPSVDRRLLDEIFGDVLPDTTADERDPSGDAGYSEQWYRENRPPHHGG